MAKSIRRTGSTGSGASYSLSGLLKELCTRNGVEFDKANGWENVYYEDAKLITYRNPLAPAPSTRAGRPGATQGKLNFFDRPAP